MGDAQADGHDAFFNTEDDKSVAELYLSPWTHSGKCHDICTPHMRVCLRTRALRL
jgi:hypothetical protein